MLKARGGYYFPRKKNDVGKSNIGFARGVMSRAYLHLIYLLKLDTFFFVKLDRGVNRKSYFIHARIVSVYGKMIVFMFFFLLFFLLTEKISTDFWRKKNVSYLRETSSPARQSCSAPGNVFHELALFLSEL